MATWPKEQRKGYGKALLSCLFEKYAPLADWITVGTGNTPAIKKRGPKDPRIT